MLAHLKQRVVATLVSAEVVTLATYGPANIQANVCPCTAREMSLYLLVPRTSDHLFNIESNPTVVVTTDAWQLRGTARRLAPDDYPDGLRLLHRPEAAWCEVVEVYPTRLQISRPDEQGNLETIDVD